MSEYLETKQESEDNELLSSKQKLAKEQAATSQASTFAKRGNNKGNYSQMLQALSYCDDIPIFPYVVSVVGHRDCCLEENESAGGYRYTEEKVKNAFREQLQGLVTAWNEKCGKQTPFIVLTGMADGADQLAAEVALEMHDQGVRVLVVLPMKIEYFRITVKNKTKFDDLLKKIKMQEGAQQNDEYVFELPFVKKNSDGDLVEDAKLNKFARTFIEKYKEKFDSLTEKSFIQLSLSEIKDVKMAGTSSQNRELEQIITDTIEQSSEIESPSSDDITFSKDPKRTINHFAIGKFGEDEKKRLRLLLHTRFVFQCQRLADFLAVHSHVLFAFWDGLPAAGIGGAATAVKFKLQGNLSYLSDCDYLTYPSVGLVAHIFTPRKNMGITYDYSEPPFSLGTKDTPPVFLWSRQELVDENNCPAVPTHADMTAENMCKDLIAKEKYLAEVFERLGKLNSYIINNYTDIKDNLNQSGESLFSHGVIIDKQTPKPKLSELIKRHIFLTRKPTVKKNQKEYSPDQDLIGKLRQDYEIKVLLDHYSVVDRLALMFQKSTKSVIVKYLWLLFFFVLLGGSISAGGVLSKDFRNSSTIFSSKSEVLNFQQPVFSWVIIVITILYVILAILILWLCHASRKKERHLAFHRCRCMAEALRIQIFWRMAGIGYSASGCYTSHQTLKTDWLRTGILGLDVLFKSPTEGEPTYHNEVCEYWIKGQAEYFKDKSIDRYDEAGDGIQNKWPLMIVAFLFVATQPFYADLVSCIYHINQGATCLDLIIIISFYVILPWILLAWFSIYTLRIQLNRLKVEAERYERAYYPFARAAYYLSNREQPQDIKKTILKQLGAEALTENADWYLAAGERELMLPR